MSTLSFGGKPASRADQAQVLEARRIVKKFPERWPLRNLMGSILYACAMIFVFHWITAPDLKIAVWLSAFPITFVLILMPWGFFACSGDHPVFHLVTQLFGIGAALVVYHWIVQYSSHDIVLPELPIMESLIVAFWLSIVPAGYITVFMVWGFISCYTHATRSTI